MGKAAVKIETGELTTNELSYGGVCTGLYTSSAVLSPFGEDKCQEIISSEYSGINFLGTSSKEHRIQNEINE